jgi:hypothetical protein
LSSNFANLYKSNNLYNAQIKDGKKMSGMDRYMYFGGIGNPLVFSEKPQDYF